MGPGEYKVCLEGPDELLGNDEVSERKIFGQQVLERTEVSHRSVGAKRGQARHERFVTVQLSRDVELDH
jgi:hypothetical protein